MNQKRDITKPGNESCDTCRQKVAEAFCIQCQDFICLQCSGYHSLSKLTKHHRILRRNEMPLRRASTSIAEICSVHNGQTCHLYCQTHKTLICQICKETFHTKCNMGFLSELAQDIEKSEKYQETEAEIKHMLQLFRALKTQLLRKFQSTRNYIERTCQGQEMLEMKAAEDQENFMNNQAECVESLTAVVANMTHYLQSCDEEIDVAETLQNDFSILEKTQQHIQLYVAINNAEERIKSMKSVYREITEQTKQYNHMIQFVQGPDTIRTVNLKPAVVVVDRCPRRMNAYKGTKLQWSARWYFDPKKSAKRLIFLLILAAFLRSLTGYYAEN